MTFTVLQPGFFAVKLGPGTITQAQLCPQNYFCQGGAPSSTFDPSNPGSLSPSEPSIKRCANGMWTLDIASYAVEQCCELHFAGSCCRSLMHDWAGSGSAEAATFLCTQYNRACKLP